MIYEMNGKPYIKVDNFFAELEVSDNVLKTPKVFKKIYQEDFNESKAKKYNSSEEYINSLRIEDDFDKREIKRKNKLL